MFVKMIVRFSCPETTLELIPDFLIFFVRAILFRFHEVFQFYKFPCYMELISLHEK